MKGHTAMTTPTTPAPDRLTKYYQAAVQEGPCGPTEAIGLITTSRVDRDGEVVIPSGIDLSEYRANPVVMWGHARGLPSEGEAGMPVGKNLWIKPTRDGYGLVAKHAFDADDEFARRVCGKVKRGVLRTYSITFQPVEVGPPTREELKAHPEWEGAKRVFRKSKLIEYSVVAMPANVDAVTLAKRGSAVDEDEVGAGGVATAEAEVETDNETGVEKAAPPPGDGKAHARPVDADGDTDGDTDADEGEEEEEPMPARGDHVRCKAPHCKGYGVVKSIHDDGMVPDVDEDIHGSKSAPACRVQMYKPKDGGFVPTAVHKGLLIKHVEKCDPLMAPKKKKAADAPARAGWTEAQKAAYKAALVSGPDFQARLDRILAERVEVVVLGRV